MSRQKLVKVSVKEDIKVKDDLNTWKRWFNGIKHFFTVKTLPPNN